MAVLVSVHPADIVSAHVVLDFEAHLHAHPPESTMGAATVRMWAEQ
jgi:hypothetical protein